MKQDGRGKHGKQGRKPTGRKRNQKLYCEFTPEEKAELFKNTYGLTQSDFILKAVRFYNENIALTQEKG